MSNPISAYQKSSLDSKILGETPYGLVCLLLRKMNEKLKIAKTLLEEKNNVEDKVKRAIEIATALGVANDILTALLDSLVEVEEGEDIYNQFSQLYQHIQHHVLMATIHQKPEYVTQAIHVSDQLIEIWESIPSEFHHMTSRE